MVVMTMTIWGMGVEEVVGVVVKTEIMVRLVMLLLTRKETTGGKLIML